MATHGLIKEIIQELVNGVKELAKKNNAFVLNRLNNE